MLFRSGIPLYLTFLTSHLFLILKKHVISLIRPQPKDVFDVFQPTLLRYLFQLRLGLSRLRHHKNLIILLTLPLIYVFVKPVSRIPVITYSLVPFMQATERSFSQALKTLFVKKILNYQQILLIYFYTVTAL